MRMGSVRLGLSMIIGAIVATGCGSGSPTPTGPSTTGGGSNTQPANVTVNITGSAGTQAFSPNPVALPAAQTLGFRNSDSTVHRIVADNGGFDSGVLQPGTSSTPLTITSSTPVPFHCTIHPGMTGTITR
jgi:plastocyanin